MLKTITIDTDTHVVVPVELLKKARLCIEDYIEGAPSDGTDEKCMDDISSILAIKQPEQAQQSDGTVINYGTMVSAEFLECFNHAFSFLANGHSIGQCFDMMKFARAELIKSMKNKPAPRQIPPINQELDEFISGLIAKELAKRGSRKIETAPRPVPTIILGKGDKLVADIFQEDEDGILRMAGVGIFDPEPGKVYGIGAKNEAIDGKAITEGNPLILIWSDKPESLQVIVEELQESIARMTRPAEPDGGAV